jgi:DNA-binding CsgD family transcriptional regulator/tetratricopeptide (TPR) repeat protein
VTHSNIQFAQRLRGWFPILRRLFLIFKKELRLRSGTGHKQRFTHKMRLGTISYFKTICSNSTKPTMELVERASFMATLETEFERAVDGEGRCILVTGEAGIGKTSLVKNFCSKKKNLGKVYTGTCDALFTPRPLAPLYDILLQMQADIPKYMANIKDRTELFTSFLRDLENQKETSLIIFEDIHWADEATMDFIKFFARRITQFRSLFILTYRDTEIDSKHPLRNILGQVPADSFTRLQLAPFSRHAVEKMATEKGYKGEDVYTISGGNPFYVNEILASYSAGVPENIKDSILSSYNRLEEDTKLVWQILSVLPTGLEIKYLRKMEPSYATAIHGGIDLKILILKENLIFFKHELYRRTVESSLSPILRIALNKKILDLLRESFEENGEIERIIHHAKNANAYEVVTHYSPIAARKAAAIGAHVEAARLYLSAIEYYHGDDAGTLIQFYESYAYECYLTSQVKEAIIYAGRLLDLLKRKNDVGRIGNCLRFLSLLYLLDGNCANSGSYAGQAIEVFANQPSSHAKAMAYSNMGRLRAMLDEKDECILWSEKAMAMAEELGDEETLCHAMNSLGTMLSKIHTSKNKGLELLHKSLALAVKNNYEEYIGHAYANLVAVAVVTRDYLLAMKILEEGIQFCEDRDFDLGTKYLLIYKARMYLETGQWNEAYSMADNFLRSEEQFSLIKVGPRIIAATIKMRRGDSDVLPYLLEAKEKAFDTGQLNRIVPAMTALLEYEWIVDRRFADQADLEYVIEAMKLRGNIYENSAFAYWLMKARKQQLQLDDFYEGFRINDKATALKAASFWKQLGCPYEQALALFQGDDEDKRESISIIQRLGADAVYNKLKFEMRTSGIKSIPRGIRKNTRSNPAHLTERELDVLQLLKEGMRNKEIGSKLFISAKTVDNHIASIFFKLDVHSRGRAIKQADRLNILNHGRLEFSKE